MHLEIAGIRQSRSVPCSWVLTAALFVLPLAGCGSRATAARSPAQPSPEAEERVVKVAAAEAGPRVWPQILRVQGSLLGDERVVVGAKVAGRVQSVGDPGGPASIWGRL